MAEWVFDWFLCSLLGDGDGAIASIRRTFNWRPIESFISETYARVQCSHHGGHCTMSPWVPASLEPWECCSWCSTTSWWVEGVHIRLISPPPSPPLQPCANKKIMYPQNVPLSTECVTEQLRANVSYVLHGAWMCIFTIFTIPGDFKYLLSSYVSEWRLGASCSLLYPTYAFSLHSCYLVPCVLKFAHWNIDQSMVVERAIMLMEVIE